MLKTIYTVGQINRHIKKLFAGDDLLAAVFVRGEVSNCKYHTSGHIYFSLKDATGTLSCIMFAGNRRGLSFHMKDGDQVVVGGTVDLYERDGRCQLYAKEIRREGEGELYEKFTRLKKQLEAEGLFRQDHKKKIPGYAATVGVVTAPTGAAIRDIQTISGRRNPYVQMILRPALVQGEGAAASIVRGIRDLDGLVDVIIVGRGGGSLEDLQAFNEEIVARAIYACETPVISAVGHETDVTIADFAADLRAPTPSAAAELAVFDYRKFQDTNMRYALTLRKGLEMHLTRHRSRVDMTYAKLRRFSPEARIRDARRRGADLSASMESLLKERLRDAKLKRNDISVKLVSGVRQVLTDREKTCALYIERMKGVNPVGRLQQGFSFTADQDGHAVRSVDGVETGDLVTIHVTDGRIRAEVKEKERDG